MSHLLWMICPSRVYAIHLISNVECFDDITKKTSEPEKNTNLLTNLDKKECSTAFCKKRVLNDDIPRKAPRERPKRGALLFKGIARMKEIATKRSFKINTQKEIIDYSPSSSHTTILVNNAATEDTRVRKTREILRERFYYSSTQTIISIKLPSTMLVQNLIQCLHRTKHSVHENNNTIYRLTYQIAVLDISSLMRLLCSYFSGRCYVSADKIYIRSAAEWELSIKYFAVVRNRNRREQRLDLLLDIAVACYIAAISNIDILDGLKTTASSITGTAAANTATFGLETAAQVVGNAVAGAAISAIVDVAVSSTSIYLAKKRKDKGEISEKEFSTKVKKTVCESSLKFVGGTTGSILGQVLIPVPVVGAFVGGFCGSLIGSGIGKGINYGIIDRIAKKKQEDEQTSNIEANNLQVHKRERRGYVPKITIYNESENCFQEKTFEKPKSKAVIWRESVVKKKREKRMDVRPFLTRWKNNSASQENEEPTGSSKERKNGNESVFSKWKLTVGKSKLTTEQSIYSATNCISSESLQAPPKDHSIIVPYHCQNSCDGSSVNNSQAMQERVPSSLRRLHESFLNRANRKDVKAESVEHDGEVKKDEGKADVKTNEFDSLMKKFSWTKQRKIDESDTTEKPDDKRLLSKLSIKSIKSTIRSLSNSSDEQRTIGSNNSVNDSSKNDSSCIDNNETDFSRWYNSYSSAITSEESSDSVFFSPQVEHTFCRSSSAYEQNNHRERKYGRLQRFSFYSTNGSVDAEGNVYSEHGHGGKNLNKKQRRTGAFGIVPKSEESEISKSHEKSSAQFLEEQSSFGQKAKNLLELTRKESMKEFFSFTSFKRNESAVPSMTKSNKTFESKVIHEHSKESNLSSSLDVLARSSTVCENTSKESRSLSVSALFSPN
ncbi:uncharacterized protein LOC130645385 [Hydractinia symbiolongicarpus]|uniref:uncharacterized protein LOC130645385 n=1 Tax=Hydractinia symbiolongicarpus TaxID=13093 RepID=UPI00254A931C|nr:uncharacterized protein LOC130645385 [Hydractinia symbiolongicarpus]